MICQPCRKGGKANTAALKYRSSIRTLKYPDDAAQYLGQAGAWHRRCDGRCDCQHQVGKCLDTGEPK